MKKIAVILLLSIYSISVMGIAVNKFYCCGKFSSVSLLENSKFNSLEKNSKPGCCKTTKTSFKVKDSHVTSSGKSLDVTEFALLPNLFSCSDLLQPVVQNKVTAFDSQAPPGSSANPIYILNCTYRI
ncbi:MAG TPA: hypothetical protein VNI52_07135 [Sphingobacteriaceae bacterium]|nr:hypothetical protein [Sphingobacteriaceae bacterium]